MNVEIRNTKKSRMVNDLAEVTADLILNGNNSPTKNDIVEATVSASVTDSVAPWIFTTLSDELANSLERYFSEVCEATSKLLEMPYHYVSNKFYKRGKAIPTSLEEAKEYVICFGNGRRGKAVGVRFVTIEDEPDGMLALATAKDLEIVNKAIETRNKKIAFNLTSGRLGKEAAEKIASHLTNSLLINTNSIRLEDKEFVR